jgi:DNA-binding MurR/RpiR family transcriptional regulator
MDLSKEINVSVSAINRFSKKLGFQGFKDLKSIILYQQKIYNNLKENNPFYNDVQFSFNESNKKINIKEIEFIVQKIIDKKNIYFYGESFTYILAEYISRKFNKINYKSRTYNVASDLSIILPQKNVVHIFISNSGKNPNIKKACEKIQQKNQNQIIISITSSSNSNIKKNSNSHVHGSFYSSIEQDEFELPSISQYITQYILDIIFNNVYKKNKTIHSLNISNISKEKK